MTLELSGRGEVHACAGAVGGGRDGKEQRRIHKKLPRNYEFERRKVTELFEGGKDQDFGRAEVSKYVSRREILVENYI